MGNKALANEGEERAKVDSFMTYLPGLNGSYLPILWELAEG